MIVQLTILKILTIKLYKKITKKLSISKIITIISKTIVKKKKKKRNSIKMNSIRQFPKILTITLYIT